MAWTQVSSVFLEQTRRGGAAQTAGVAIHLNLLIYLTLADRMERAIPHGEIRVSLSVQGHYTDIRARSRPIARH